MKLARLFAVSTALLALLVVALFGRLMLLDWDQYRSSAAGLRSMELTRQAMVAVEKLSGERRPSNAVLGDATPADPAKAARLARARTDTDAALRELRSALLQSRNPLDARALADLDATLAVLPAARAQVDQVAGLPRGERSPALTTRAVQGMIAVVPSLLGSVTVLSRNAANAYPQLTGTLTAARLAVDLREDAGKLGSQFTTALTTGQALTESESDGIQTLRGRIEQLRILLEQPIRSVGAQPAVSAALQEMDQQYFGGGLDVVAQTLRASRQGRPYGMDAAGFAARYAPHMDCIVRLREALLAVAIDGARQAHASARAGLLLLGATAAGVLALLATLLVLVRRHVLHPLQVTTQALVRLAEGDMATGPALSTRRDEIGDLLRALHALRAVAIAKRTLERSHQTLIEELKLASSTDHLTGILNRRAFSEAAGARAQSARSAHAPLAVVMFDIDRFKAVNDRYGHDAGDQVLRELAAVVAPELREGEILARYGGEEFIAMPLNCDRDGARAVAERLRAAIEATAIELADGRVLHVTASFGVATGGGPTIDLARLIHAADVALYRAKEGGRNRVEVEEVEPVSDGQDTRAA